MHPAMAVWIWSMAMMRASQSSLYGYGNWLAAEPAIKPIARNQSEETRAAFVPANIYLHSDIAKTPLPAPLLDRLADLYWMERDSELAI